MGLSLAVAASLLPAQPSGAAELSDAASGMPFISKAGSISVSKEHITYDEPFAQWTAGCQYFRIPALITLQDGTLLATADARWETFGDGGGIDSIASISEDGGKTWQYSFPLFFPDSQGYAGRDATTIIDPGIVEGPDGTIYFIADVNPTGSTTMYKTIGTGTGYVTVENEVDSGRYLAITEEYTNVDTEPSDGDLQKYPYYVGDLDENGFAEIKRRDDGSGTGYGVDEWYNLYTVENGEFTDNLTQKQVNGERRDIQQNVFYKDSKYHVYSIDYLWVITSKDGGKTWEHPRDLTDMIKRHTDEHGLLVSPGQGITTSIGDIVIGFYNTQDGEENASLVYSVDNGKTWGRTDDVAGASAGGLWTSENEVVELWDGTLRMFLRNGRQKICYADAVKKEDGTYEFESPVITDIPSITTGNGCNISAISYSKPVDGRQLILVTTPTGSSRAKGRIFAFLVEPDHSMTLLNTFEIPEAESGYVYSCLTEMEDGTIALLWEPNKWETTQVSILFDKFSVLDIVPQAAVEGASVNVEIGKGETYTRTYAGGGDFTVTKEADAEVAGVEQKRLDGDKTVSITGTGAGYTEAVIDQVLYKIKVRDNTTYLDLDQVYMIEDVNVPPENIADGPITVTTTENGTLAMFDHVSNTAGSLSSFSSSKNSGINLSEAEFTLTGSGTTYQVYNESKNLYLKNTTVSSFFGSGASDMKITSEDGGFRICQTGGQRYIIFYFNEMNFNTNTNYSANYENGSYEVALLEKQASVSEDDTLPGYKSVTSITSGRKYLIAYVYEGSVIVLYPENGVANQTKLVRKASDVAVEAVEPGELDLTIDGKDYHFKSVDACEHTQKKVVGEIPAGCLLEGYTGDTYCASKACGRFMKEGSSVPAAGSHDWDAGEVTKPATETENGEKVYTCTRDPFHKKTEVIYAYAYASVKTEYDAAASLLDESSEFYQPEGIEKLKSACEEYKEAVESGYMTSQTVRNALAAFLEANGCLEQKSAEDLTEDLTGLLEEMNSDYKAGQKGLPEAVWSDFKRAYDDAEQAAAGDGFEVLTGKIRTLKNAHSVLKAEKEKLAAAKENLRQKVEAANQAYAAGESAYTKETWDAFAEKYKNAQNPPADASAEALDKLAEELFRAQNALVKAEPKQPQPQPQPQPPAEKDPVRVVNGISYEITDAAAKKAKVVGASKASVKIPANVTIEKVSYAVTAIDAKAFRGSKALKNVVIGDKVTSIGANAFSGCKKLTSVTIGKKVKTISKQAFFNCTRLKKIILKSKNIKPHKTAFKKTAAKITVQMPKGLSKSKRQKLFRQLKAAGVSKKAKMK